MTECSLDTLLRLVADRRRRRVVRHLRRDANGNTTFDDLVDWLDNRSIADDRATDRDRLAIQLHHVHLPKLADHGVVEFDPENRTVRYRPDEQIETVLDSLPDELSQAHP